jgi:sulfur transfer complex TusBCD TusB component (DsrH family)
MRNLEFAIDPRNIRIVMSTYDINPFMNNSVHSTWPIVLTILNLLPWLCNKQKYILMLGLIPGPQQPRNDIDTYFRTLVEDQKVLLYNNGVEVWDEHKHKYFQLKAILIVTITDSPVARNLSRQSKKVGCRCPHCFKETNSQYLSESQKIVYMGHRRYIPKKHQF